MGAENRRKWRRICNTERGYKGNNPWTPKEQSPHEPATVLWASKRVNSLSQGRRGYDPFLGTSHPKHEKGSTSKTPQHCTAKTAATAGIYGTPQTVRVLLLLWLLSPTNIQKSAHSLYPYLLPEGHLFRDEPNSQKKCTEKRLGCLLRFSLEALPAGWPCGNQLDLP